MGRLDAGQVRNRLRFDNEVARQLRADSIGRLRGFSSMTAYRAGQEASPADGEAGRVTVYEAELIVPHLVGPGVTAERAVVLFDLAAGGNYPYSAPAVTVISRPFPWSPHVHDTTGAVCIGDGWVQAKGKMLFPQLLVHVMRLLNCDEPDRGVEYGGWNLDAAEYWRRTLRCRPLSPGFVYPVLPTEVTHATEAPDCSFSAARRTGADAFVPVRTADAGFRPIGGGR